MPIASGQVQGYNNPDINETLQISSGVVTVSGPGKKIIQAETGTTDQLDKLVGLNEGDKVTLFADTGDTITVADGSFMELSRSLDMPLTGNNSLKLISIGSDVCVESGGRVIN